MGLYLDQDPKKLDVKEILCQILGQKNEGSPLEKVQSELRKLLVGKKFLLVLGDLWTENHQQWEKLVKFLTGGRKLDCTDYTFKEDSRTKK